MNNSRTMKVLQSCLSFLKGKKQIDDNKVLEILNSTINSVKSEIREEDSKGLLKDITASFDKERNSIQICIAVGEDKHDEEMSHKLLNRTDEIISDRLKSTKVGNRSIYFKYVIIKGSYDMR